MNVYFWTLTPFLLQSNGKQLRLTIYCKTLRYYSPADGAASQYMGTKNCLKSPTHRLLDSIFYLPVFAYM